MNKATLEKQRTRLERRIANARYTELHRDSMRKAYADTGQIKMHEFRGGRTVQIDKHKDGSYSLVVWNGSEHVCIENRLFNEDDAVKFATVLFGKIGWNIK